MPERQLKGPWAFSCPAQGPQGLQPPQVYLFCMCSACQGPPEVSDWGSLADHQGHHEKLGPRRSCRPWVPAGPLTPLCPLSARGLHPGSPLTTCVILLEIDFPVPSCPHLDRGPSSHTCANEFTCDHPDGGFHALPAQHTGGVDGTGAVLTSHLRDGDCHGGAVCRFPTTALARWWP